MDVEQYLNTLEMIKGIQADCFIPAHAEVTREIAPLAQLNIEKVQEIGEKLAQICREPVTFESILIRLFDEYSLVMSFEQYALVGSTVKSYLTWLLETGLINVTIDDNMLKWVR